MLKSSLLTLCLLGTSSAALYTKKTAPPSYKKRTPAPPSYEKRTPTPSPPGGGDESPPPAPPVSENTCSPEQLTAVADWRAQDSNLKQCREAALNVQMSTAPQGNDLIFNAETCEIESCYKFIHELATKYAPDCTIGDKNAKEEAQNALKKCIGIAEANGVNTNDSKKKAGEFSQADRPSPLLTTVVGGLTLVALLF